MKPTTLYAYKITPTEITDAPHGFISVLRRAVEQNPTVRERMLELNKKSPDSDCLMNMENVEGDLFGLFARLVPGDNVGLVPEEVLEKQYARAIDLQAGEGSAMSYKKLTYFYIGREHLILDYHSARNFEVYFNSLSGRIKTGSYRLLPDLSMPDDIPLSDISSVRLDGSFNIQTQSDGRKSLKRILLNSDMLSSLLGGSAVAEELVDNKLLSASVLLKLERKKPEEMERSDYENLMSRALSLGSDAVSVRLKNKKTVRGGEIRKSRDIQIENLSNGLIDEASLKIEMANFMRSLEHEA